MINRLSGFGDRAGEKSSGGRDIGVQLSGDILPNASGRKLLHYQVGVYNGEGINRSDKNNQKDIIGGIWVMPMKASASVPSAGTVVTAIWWLDIPLQEQPLQTMCP